MDTSIGISELQDNNLYQQKQIGQYTAIQRLKIVINTRTNKSESLDNKNNFKDFNLGNKINLSQNESKQITD